MRSLNISHLICCAASFGCTSCCMFVANEIETPKDSVDKKILGHAQDDLSLHQAHELIGIYQLDKKEFFASTGMDSALVSAIVIGAEHFSMNQTQELKKQVKFLLAYSHTDFHFAKSTVGVFECFYNEPFTLSNDDIIVKFRTNHKGKVLGMDVKHPRATGDFYYYEKLD